MAIRSQEISPAHRRVIKRGIRIGVAAGALVFLGIWLSQHGIPADQIGLINALPTLCLLLLNIAVGRIADKLDDWRTALIVAGVGVLVLVGLVLAAP